MDDKRQTNTYNRDTIQRNISQHQLATQPQKIFSNTNITSQPLLNLQSDVRQKSRNMNALSPSYLMLRRFLKSRELL